MSEMREEDLVRRLEELGALEPPDGLSQAALKRLRQTLAKSGKASQPEAASALSILAAMEDAEEVEEVQEVQIEPQAKPRREAMSDKKSGRPKLEEIAELAEGMEDAAEVEAVEEVSESPARNKKPAPRDGAAIRQGKAAKSRVRADDFEEEEVEEAAEAQDDDDNEEQAHRWAKKRKKAGMSPLVLMGGGVGVAAAVGVVLFLVLSKPKSGGTQTAAAPAKNQVPSGPPSVPAVNPAVAVPSANAPASGSQPPTTVAAVAQRESPNTDPEKEQGTAKAEPTQPIPEADPAAADVYAVDVYKRLLKSAVYIYAEQRIPLRDELAGTHWMGTESRTTAGEALGRVQLDFEARGQVQHKNQLGAGPGTYKLDGRELTMKFNVPTKDGKGNFGELLYRGTLSPDRKRIDGTAHMYSPNNPKFKEQNWNFTVFRQQQTAGRPGMPGMPGGGGMPGMRRGGGGMPGGGMPRGGMPPGGMRPPGSGKDTVDLPKYKISRGTGSGEIVDLKHRLILTNVHVVGKFAEPEKLVLYFPMHVNGELKTDRDFYEKGTPGYKGRVVMTAPDADLALVQVDKLPDGVDVVPFSTQRVRTAQRVHAIGNPGASAGLWNYSVGNIRAVIPNHKWKVNDRETRFTEYHAWYIETNAPTNPGNSGGPLVDDRAAMVGVCHAGIPPAAKIARDMTMFIHVREARALLERYYKSIEEKWEPVADPPWPKELARVPALVAQLDQKDSALQLEAIQELSRLGSYAALAFQKLFRLAKSPDEVVRRVAIDALERVPPDKDDLKSNRASGWPGLINICIDPTESLEIRMQALKSLARLEGRAKAALPKLEKQFRGADAAMRRQLMATMVAIGPSASELALLRDALKSGDIDTSRLAAEGLAKLGEAAKPAVQELITALKSPDVRTRLAALRGLQTAGETKQASARILGLLNDKEREVRLAAADALVGLGEAKEAMPVLTEVMKFGSPLARRRVCRLLGTVAASGKPAIGSIARTAAEDLIDVLSDPKVRTAASNALIKIGKPAADLVAARMTRIEDDRARLECIYILGQIGHASAQVGKALWIVAHSDPLDQNQEEAWKVISKLTGGNFNPADLKKGG